VQSKKIVRNFSAVVDEHSDEVAADPEAEFEMKFFNPLLDQALSSLKQRFEQLDNMNANWSFLYDLEKLDTESLAENCKKLQRALTQPAAEGAEGSCQSDINADEMTLELCTL